MIKIKNKISKFINRYNNYLPDKITRIIILIFPLLIFSLKTFKLDNDFWFLINTGKEILSNGFITTEYFTIHEGLFFIAQQWLTDIIFYILYTKFNIYGLVALLYIINIVILILLYKLALLISNYKYKISLYITVIIDCMFIFSFLTTRPHIFDILIILLEIYILELYIRKNKKNYLLILPLLSILMINLHASSWLMLFVILVPYYIGRINLKFTSKETYKLKNLIIITIIMLLCGFINPYKLDAILYIFKSYGFTNVNNHIIEMLPVNISDSLYIYLYIFIILIFYYMNKGKKINLRYLLLFLGTLYLGLKHGKGLLFFYIGSFLAIIDNLSKMTKNNNNLNNINNKIIYKQIPLYFLVIFTFLLLYIKNVDLSKEEDMNLYKIANYLDTISNKDIKLYTSYGDGGYLEYRGYKCYMDARAEIFYKKLNRKDDILNEYFKLQDSLINPREFIKKYNFDYFVVYYKDILYYYLENMGYELIYSIPSNGGTKEIYRVYKNK